MSIHIISEAWDRSSAEGSRLLVLLALSDNANKQTRLAWPSVEDLARRSRLSERQVQRHLRGLEDAADITLVEPGHGTGTGTGLAAVYRVHPGGILNGDADVTDRNPLGDIQGTVRATPMSPQPSIEPSDTTSNEVVCVSNALKAHVKEVTGKDKQPTKTDLKTIERMGRLDRVDLAEVARFLAWLDQSTSEVAQFWAPNILSATKLREKYPQVRAQAARESRSAGRRRDGMTDSEHRAAVLAGAQAIEEGTAR